MIFTEKKKSNPIIPRIFLNIYTSVILLVFFGGCTGDFPIGNGDDKNAGPAYYPNIDGSRWSYSYRKYLNNVPYEDVSYINERFYGEREINGTLVQEFVISNGFEISPQPRKSFVRDNDKNLVEIFGYEIYSVDSEDVITEIFDSPWQDISYPLQVGKSWQSGFGIGLSPIIIGLPDDIDGDGQSDVVDVEINCYVSAKEDITTPAGYFAECYKIKKSFYVEYYLSAGITESMEFTQYRWFYPEVGFVRSIGDEIGYPNGPQLDFSRDLISFEIVKGEI